MNMQTKDGWRKPRSIYRSFFGSGVLTVGVIAIVCLVVVVVCHLFETPPPEVNALRYTYAHAGIIVAVASMVFGFTAIHVTLKLNESVKIQEFHQRYSGELALKAIREVADAIVLLFNVIEPMEAMINDDYNWHEFHGLMSVLKDVYPSFLARTQSHHDRPVYWDANTKSWVEQESANGNGA